MEEEKGASIRRRHSSSRKCGAWVLDSVFWEGGGERRRAVWPFLFVEGKRRHVVAFFRQ